LDRGIPKKKAAKSGKERERTGTTMGLDHEWSRGVSLIFLGSPLAGLLGFVNRRLVKQSFPLRASNEHVSIVRVARTQETNGLPSSPFL